MCDYQVVYGINSFNFNFNLLKYLIHLLWPVPLLTMKSATQ